MDICIICFAATVPEAMPEHLRFHKRHNHHGPMCALHIPRPGLTLDTDPPVPCTCPMQFVWAG